MLKKYIALPVSAALIASQAAAQITIHIPGLPGSRTGGRARQFTVPVLSGGRTSSSVYTTDRSNRLVPPNEASGYNRATTSLDAGRKKQLDAWQQAASKGDLLAAYKVGRAFETGNFAYPSGRPNLSQAISWYNRAAGGGNLNAMYHLGTLMVTRNAMAVDSSGVVRPDIAGGRRMMDYAVQHGYDAATDTVRPQGSSNSDNTTAVVVGSLAALILVGVMAGGDSSKSSSNDESDSDGSSLRSCSVPQTNYSTGDTTYVGALGSACDAVGAIPH